MTEAERAEALAGAPCRPFDEADVEQMAFDHELDREVAASDMTDRQALDWLNGRDHYADLFVL